MAMRPTPRPALLLTTILTALLAGCNGPGPFFSITTTTGPERVQYDLDFTDPSGFVVLHVANPQGLGGHLALAGHLRYADLVPLQMTLVAPDGTVRQVLHGTEFDNSHNVQGDGVVHAGAGPAAWASPSVDDGSTHATVIEVAIDLQSWTEAHLIVLWARQEQPPTLRTSWANGTAVSLAASGDVVLAELKDLRGGAHLGSPALAASVADAMHVRAGQVWGDVRVFRANAAVGELGVTADGERHVLPLAYDCSLFECGSSFDVRRIHFSSAGGATLDATFAGNARNTHVLATFALLPEAILPAVYHEAEEAFP